MSVDEVGDRDEPASNTKPRRVLETLLITKMINNCLTDEPSLYHHLRLQRDQGLDQARGG